VGSSSSRSGHAAAAFSLSLNARVLPRPESFRLTIGRSGVALVAADAAGLFYGTLCLGQIIDLYATPRDASANAPSADPAMSAACLSLPALLVEDSPDFCQRGVVLDARFPAVPRRDVLLAQVWARMRDVVSGAGLGNTRARDRI
jgi:membrane-associated phospholipid phosphatase